MFQAPALAPGVNGRGRTMVRSILEARAYALGVNGYKSRLTEVDLRIIANIQAP
jgi:hypothetical protein